MLKADSEAALADLDGRLKVLLPPDYHDTYESIEPVPMRSAGLKYADDGQVAWDEMWGSFCDLAMAGGPPHKGSLLEPATSAAIDAQHERYEEVVDEIARGIALASDLNAGPSPHPGWVRVHCFSDAMAGWLLRAIVMENVAARVEGQFLDLPAGPDFQLDREIKNVITVAAKTCHYWLGHMDRDQKAAIAELFAALKSESPLIAPYWPADGHRTDEDEQFALGVAARIEAATGLSASTHRAGWIGIACPDVRAAIWMMRAMVTMNVVSRREEAVLFVPVNPAGDPGGHRLWSVVTRVHRLAQARKIT